MAVGLAKLVLRITGLILFFCFSQNLGATVHYVSSDNEIEALNNSLLPGDSIVMLDGVWNNADFEFKGNGTFSKPITLTVETPGGVTLEQNSKIEFSGSYLVVDGLIFQNGDSDDDSVISFRTNSSTFCHNCRLTNVSIDSYNSSNSTNNKWVSIYGTNNRVDHCSFENKTNLGTTLVVWMDNIPDHHRIDHNYFGPRPELGQNGGAVSYTHLTLPTKA